MPDGRRRLQLTTEERKIFQEMEVVEAAVALYLDLGQDRNLKEIADILHLSERQLKYLTQSQEFVDLYNEHFIELGHDPRLRAVKSGLTELLPRAFRELEKLLENTETPATVRFMAIQKIFALNGIKPQEDGKNDKRELADFLKDAGVVNITQNNYGTEVSNEFEEALAKAESGVVDEYPSLADPVPVDPQGEE